MTDPVGNIAEALAAVLRHNRANKVAPANGQVSTVRMNVVLRKMEAVDEYTCHSHLEKTIKLRVWSPDPTEV